MKKQCTFLASSLMGHGFYSVLIQGRTVATVKGDKRLAMRLAKAMGLSWQPLDGLIVR